MGRQAMVAGLALLLGAAVYIYYARILEHRWAVGAYLLDMGWFNDLVGGRTLALDNPRGVGTSSFYAVHVSPILVVFAGLSRLFRFEGVQPLVFTLGLGFGGAAAMAFVIFERFLRPLGAASALAGALVGGLLYGVTGVMRATADYAHIEILYVPTALLALHLLFQGVRPWAWAALALCLATREDAGLHLACIIAAYLVLAAIDEQGAPRRLRMLAAPLAACLVYPALAILWQSTVSGSGGTFSAIYIGMPPFHHLTRHLLAHRATLLTGEQAWVSLTVLGGMATLPFLPRWTAMTGLVAAAPWFLLNIVAQSDAAGEFRLYYAFPFLVTVLSPLIVASAPDPSPEQEGLDVVPL